MTMRTVFFVGILLTCQSSGASAASLAVWSRGAPFSDARANHVIPCGPSGFLVSWAGWSAKKVDGDYFRVSRIQFLDKQGASRLVGPEQPTIFRDMVCHGNRFVSMDWDGNLAAWNLTTGAKIWTVKSMDPGKDWSGRIAASLDGTSFVVAASSHGKDPVVVVRAVTWNGRIVWTRRVPDIQEISYITALFQTKTGRWWLGIDDRLLSIVPNDTHIDQRPLPEKTTAAVPWSDDGILATGPFGLIGLVHGKKVLELSKPAPLKNLVPAGERRVVVVGQDGLVFSLDPDKRRVRWLKILGRLGTDTTFQKYMGKNHRGAPRIRSRRIVDVTQDSVIGRPAVLNGADLVLVALGSGRVVALRDRDRLHLSIARLARLADRLASWMSATKAMLSSSKRLSVFFWLFYGMWLLFAGSALTVLITTIKEQPGWMKAGKALWALGLVGLTVWSLFNLGAWRGAPFLEFSNGGEKDWLDSARMFIQIGAPFLAALTIPLSPKAWTAAILLPYSVVLPFWAMGAYLPDKNLLVQVSIQDAQFLLPSLALVWAMMLVGVSGAALVNVGGSFFVRDHLSEKFDWCRRRTILVRNWLAWITGMAAVLGMWQLWRAPMQAFVPQADLGIAVAAIPVAGSIWIFASQPNIMTLCDDTDQDATDEEPDNSSDEDDSDPDPDPA